jgi:predicted RNA polymerase sigma factor
VRLSHAIALGMAQGPRAGLAALEGIADSYRVDAARGHLLERAGDHAAAIDCFRRAAARTASIPERDYLLLHAARLAER